MNANEVQAVFFEGQAQVDRLFALYHQILGCLVLTAERVEAQIERGDFEIHGRANLSGGVEIKQRWHSTNNVRLADGALQRRSDEAACKQVMPPTRNSELKDKI